MRDTKRQINSHSFLDFPVIERHLEKMAADGWMLTKVDTSMWKYKRIEPQKLHFSITFFPTPLHLIQSLLRSRKRCGSTVRRLDGN